MTLVRNLTPAAPAPRALSPLRRLLRLSPSEADFATRDFNATDPSRRDALEAAGRAFIGGYNAALDADHNDDIIAHFASVAPALRGFAAEGAAMGVAIGDALPFRRARLPSYLAATERDFTYLVHVGAGWALARTPWRRRRAILKALDPIHGWLAFDGLGFHDGYFQHKRIAGGWRRQTQGYAARTYDQGIGRAMWFVSGGAVTTAAQIIATLPAERHADLWSGLGLAMAYAGPADIADVIDALRLSGTHVAAFAQGVAFAAEARVRARFVPPSTEHVVVAVWASDTTTVARLVRAARARLPASDASVPRYERWRHAIADAFAERSLT